MPLPVSVLLIDDEEVMRNACSQLLTRRGYLVQEAADGPAGLALLRRQGFDMAIVDLRLPGMGGFEILRRIREDSPGTLVIIITGHATVASAVEAMKLGAYDFLPKPFTPDELAAILNRALEKRRLETENIYLREELRSLLAEEMVLGSDRRMREIYELVGKVAPTDATVLLSGESGTGKELVARAIHRASMRQDGPFVAVDCGSIVPTLFESEIFGHVRGAFTDAKSEKRGKFELANGGTLFLDEIGNIAVDAQAKLLRAIQEREVTRVGGTQSRPIDVRIIAATNRDLRQDVAQGRFRDDLYYRINVVSLSLPPLRERRGDVQELVRHFIAKYNGRCKKTISGIEPQALDMLRSYSWPGNIRELENVVERAVILSEGNRILAKDLPSLRLESPAGPPAPHDACLPDGMVAAASRPLMSLAEMEKECILAALKAHGGNKTKAAASLGIGRKTLHLKLKSFGIGGLPGVEPAS